MIVPTLPGSCTPSSTTVRKPAGAVVFCVQTAISQAPDTFALSLRMTLSPQTIACLEDEGFTLSVMPFRTTAENLARYFFDHLREQGLPIAQIDVYETPNNCAIYRG